MADEEPVETPQRWTARRRRRPTSHRPRAGTSIARPCPVAIGMSPMACAASTPTLGTPGRNPVTTAGARGGGLVDGWSGGAERSPGGARRRDGVGGANA
jgi:hypothetical protein